MWFMPELTPEQIAQIKGAIAELPPEEQEAKAKEMIAQINPEALQQQCPFCLMSEGKIPTTKVYSDERYMAVLEINPANPGHVLLFAKRHVSTFVDLSQEEVGDLARLAQVLLKSLHKLFPASNIHADNGEFAGQRFPHFVLQLIPRKQGDKVQFAWESSKVTPEELAKIKDEIYANLPQQEEPQVAREEITSMPVKKRLP